MGLLDLLLRLEGLGYGRRGAEEQGQGEVPGGATWRRELGWGALCRRKGVGGGQGGLGVRVDAGQGGGAGGRERGAAHMGGVFRQCLNGRSHMLDLFRLLPLLHLLGPFHSSCSLPGLLLQLAQLELLQPLSAEEHGEVAAPRLLLAALALMQLPPVFPLFLLPSPVLVRTLPDTLQETVRNGLVDKIMNVKEKEKEKEHNMEKEEKEKKKNK